MIDVERIRKKLKEEDYGAFFGGGFGGAMAEALSIDSLSADEVIRLAKQRGIDVSDCTDEDE